MESFLPILTLLLGQLIGYWFAVGQTKRRIAAEKRAEYASRFIGEAYGNLRCLANRQAAEEGSSAMASFSVLGQQAGFFLSDEAAKAIDQLTTTFAGAILYLRDPDPQAGRDVWKEYREQLERVRERLRREVRASQ